MNAAVSLVSRTQCGDRKRVAASGHEGGGGILFSAKHSSLSLWMEKDDDAVFSFGRQGLYLDSR